MLDAWLETGSLGIVVIPFLFLYGVAAFVTWLTHVSPARPFFASCIGIAGPFFASVAVLFSLFAVFLASEVWHQSERARLAIASEADGIRTIMRVAETAGEAGRPLKAEVVEYTNQLLTVEWPAMTEGRIAGQSIQSIQALLQAVVDPKVVAAMPATVHGAIVDAFVQIRHARPEREAVAARHGASLNWLSMLILGVLTQVAIAVVQLDKLRPQALALFVFTTAFAATVALIGLHERPFATLSIDDAPLRAALATASD